MINEKDSNKNNEETEIAKAEDNEEMLGFLIKEYGMNTKSLSKLLEIEASFLDNFSENKNNIPMEKRGLLSGILGTLFYNSKITADERNRAVIDVLTQEHNISLDTIARMANVREEDIENFMNSSNLISDDTKYKIATVSMFLHFMFKPSEDKFRLTVKAIKAGIDNEGINKLTGSTYEEIDSLRILCQQQICKQRHMKE
ncbi:MAG: hypothetical protein Q8936_20790 [Bacillota bacterium]|nr:hypothetical protein [Bacillota bacterium]